MPDERIPREDELEDRQGHLYPVGRALRDTFDAENHDSLGTDLTGLMLALARIDPDAPVPGRGVLPPAAPVPAPAAVAAPVEAVAPAAPRSWLARLIGRLLA